MKHLFSILPLLLYIVTASAQNLIPNSNFAQFNACPSDLGQINKCKYWYNPSIATSDYFNACHDTMAGSPYTAGVPTNAYGTQPSSSNAYINLGTYGGPSNYREYARANIPALIKGAVYQVLLKVSLAEFSLYATNAPNVFFYIGMDSFVATNAVLPYTPQVDYNGFGNIMDMTNWVNVVDTFTADSAYSHLIIGNFKNDALTTKTANPGGLGITYYYIDSISVEKIADPSIINTNANGEIKATLYPNPFMESAVLNIDNLPIGSYTLSIMNVQGAVVREMENIRSGQTIIQREGLPPGFYYYRLQAGDGVVLRGKMIIH